MSFYKEVPGRKTTLESTLKFDTEPKAGSTNPVTSEGVKSAIDGAVGDAAAAIQQQVDDIAEKAGSGYIPKGEATVATLNALSGQENGELYTMTDAGTLTLGSLAVVAGDTVAWDDTNSVWYKAMDYAPRQYGTNEVHNLPTTITAFRTGDYIAVDGTDTAKMSKDDLLTNIHENELSSGNTITKNLWVQNNLVAFAGNPAYVSKFVYVDGITSVKVVPKTTAVIRFLKSVPAEVNGTAFDYATNAGSSVTTETTFTLSSDTKYMYIGIKYNNGNVEPNDVVFDGVSYKYFAFENLTADLASLNENLAENIEEVSEISDLLEGNTMLVNCNVDAANEIRNYGNSAYESLFIAVEGISSIKVTPISGKNAVIRFLTGLPTFANGSPLPLATNPGSSVSEETTFTLSSDTKYMYVLKKYNNGAFFPESILFDGVSFDQYEYKDYEYVVREVQAMQQDVSAVERRLDGNTITKNCWMQSGSTTTLINVGNSAYATKFVYVEGISSVKVTPISDKIAIIRFLKTLPNFVEGATLNLASTPGSSVSEETTFTLSSDTKYMLIGETYNNGNFFPESILFDGVSFDDYSFETYESELRTIRSEIKDIENMTGSVKFRKDSATQFSLYKKLNNGKLARHVWKRDIWTSQEGNVDVTDCDCWVASDVYVDGVVIAQCNINFIYNMTETESGTAYSYFVGSGHGCCVENYTDFYIDGKIVDFSSLANGTEIECDEIRLVMSANCWAASRARTVANGGDGNKVYAMVDGEGNPILSTIWNLDYTFDATGEHYNNQLTAKRNGTKFNQCFGAMNSTQPNEFDHLHENDQFGSCCSWVYESNTHTITSIYGQNLNSTMLKGISKATQHGSEYSLSVECENVLVPYVGHVRNWFEDGGRGRMKVYLNPIKTIDSDGSSGADVFNDGDIIRCKVERLLS